MEMRPKVKELVCITLYLGGHGAWTSHCNSYAIINFCQTQTSIGELLLLLLLREENIFSEILIWWIFLVVLSDPPPAASTSDPSVLKWVEQEDSSVDLHRLSEWWSGKSGLQYKSAVSGNEPSVVDSFFWLCPEASHLDCFIQPVPSPLTSPSLF